MLRKINNLSLKSIISSSAHIDMLIKHDERNFAELKKIAEKLLASEGFDKSSIETISRKMAKELEIYASFDDGISQGKISLDTLRRDLTYITEGRKIPRLVLPLYKAMLSTTQSLKENPVSAYYKSLWYAEYLIKKRTNSISSYLRIAWNLFREQEQKFGWKTALEIMPYLIIAGFFGHDKRNRGIAIKYFAICNEKIKKNHKAGFVH